MIGAPLCCSRFESTAVVFGASKMSDMSPTENSPSSFARTNFIEPVSAINCDSAAAWSSALGSSLPVSESRTRHSMPVSSIIMFEPASSSRVFNSAALCSAETFCGFKRPWSSTSGVSPGSWSLGRARGAVPGISSDRCSSALNATPQPPQRTLPAAFFRTSAVTRKALLQSGHWVNMLVRFPCAGQARPGLVSLRPQYRIVEFHP